MQPLSPAKATKHQIDWINNSPFAEQEIWMNDTYTVFVRRHIPVPQFVNEKGEVALITWLSIKRNDRSAKPDWRDFQWIKNQLVGEECEGVELFPAESRLVDGSNQYHLWVFEDDSFRFPFGFNERSVTESDLVGNTQRKFPLNRRPKDIDEHEQKAKEMLQSLQQQYTSKKNNHGNI